MTCDLVVFNNAIPIKPFTVDVVMGFDEEGNTAYYWLKKNHSDTGAGDGDIGYIKAWPMPVVDIAIYKINYISAA